MPATPSPAPATSITFVSGEKLLAQIAETRAQLKKKLQQTLTRRKTGKSPNSKFHIKVKMPVEIALSTLHLGYARRVVTLAINGKDPAEDFLSKLQKDDRNKLDSITTRIKAVANYPRYENQNHSFKKAKSPRESVC